MGFMECPRDSTCSLHLGLGISFALHGLKSIAHGTGHVFTLFLCLE